MDIEQAARENKLAELAILQQSLEDRNKRISDLEKKVEILEGMLTRAASIRVPFPQPLPQRLAPTPRRWSVKS
jgi:hypothetical protein